MQYAPKRSGFFSFWGRIGCWIFLTFSVLNVFPTSFQRIPNIPNAFLKMFITCKRGQFWPKPLWDKSVVPIGNIWGELLRTPWELDQNTLGTHTKPPQNWASYVHAALPQNWLSRIVTPPFACHHFQPWLMDRG
jgi:hypothetical protein